MPIYQVNVEGEAKPRAVDASTKSSAINHVIRGMVTAKPLSATEAVALMQSGVQVEKAAKETETATA